jgi:glycosyltransferase involved in cell wall biosynthesis
VKPLKILMSNYACEPHEGSEPGVGWNIAREVARNHETWVITREDFRPSIEAELAERPAPQLHFVYVDLPRWARWWWWQGEGILKMHLHYYLWQIAIYFEARKLHHQIGFDIVHHVTFTRYWGPSFLSLLPPPFIWGPVGGGESAPRSFWKDFGYKGILFESLRVAARWIEEHDPFVRLTARRSALALATTEETAIRLRRLGAKPVRILSEVGLSREDIAQLGDYTMPDAPLRFVSIGRLLHWKGFHLGLQAFAEAALPEAEYWIVGDGFESKRLKTLARELNIADQVCFWGELPRHETLNKLAECHVLVHPSMHEAGGWVCSEALAAGKPVVCLDLGGPGTQITKETGFKIPAHDLRQTVVGLSEAMKQLAGSRALMERMSEKARELIAQEYSWSQKGEELGLLYAHASREETIR